MNDLLSGKNTISSVEIAKRAGKQHNNLMRDIRKMFAALDIGALKFERTYIDSQDKERPCFHLDSYYTRLLVTGWDTKMRAEVVGYFENNTAITPARSSGMESFDIMQGMLDSMRSQHMQIQDHQARINAAEDKLAIVQKSIGQNNDYMSIKAWVNVFYKPRPGQWMKAIGTKCGKHCRGDDIKIGKVKDERWGHVNSYPIFVIAECVRAYEEKLIELQEKKDD